MNWLKALVFCPFLAIGQLVPPPSGSQPVDLDTVSGVDTSLFTIQIPPYLGGSSVKLRRLTLEQLVDYVGAEVDTGYVGNAISDSITAFGRDTAQAAAFTGVYADSVNTPILRLYGAQFVLSDSPDFVTYKGNMIFNGGIGFFGKFPTVFAPCPLPYATPPNPVTEAQARAAYDLALQNCLDESGVNLVNTP